MGRIHEALKANLALQKKLNERRQRELEADLEEVRRLAHDLQQEFTPSPN